MSVFSRIRKEPEGLAVKIMEFSVFFQYIYFVDTRINKNKHGLQCA